MTAQYSEVRKKDMTPHVLPHCTAAEGNYFVLKRDDVSHTPPRSTTGGGDYSVLKREEREVS